MKKCWCLIGLFLVMACKPNTKKEHSTHDLERQSINSNVFLTVLGTVQDAGSPHIACKKECCANLFENPDNTRKIVSLGLVDNENQQTFLFEATPDITEQLKMLKKAASWPAEEIPNGIFLTHAHIGHYTGLMYLGKEATNATEIPVFGMPKMQRFLQNNGPWSQLVTEKNIALRSLQDATEDSLNSNCSVRPFRVPHRDEFSETVGYQIIGPTKKALFIPDIDKWENWNKNILDEIAKVDYAFIDATFYDGAEISNRDISQIPHPFVIESMAMFEKLPASEKQKIHFIHFNHTNPLLNEESPEAKKVRSNGFRIARINDQFAL